ADAVVTLTERLAKWLTEEAHWVTRERIVRAIPCCVDLERFVPSDARRAKGREEISAGDRLVVVYAGNLGSWYCEDEMARLYAKIRAKRSAMFLVLSRADASRLRAQLAALGVPDGELCVRSGTFAEMPMLLAAGDVGISFA